MPVQFRELNVAQQIENARQKLKQQILTALIERALNAVRVARTLGLRQAIFSVPLVMWGFPNYNVGSAARAVAKRLSKQGFQVAQVSAWPPQFALTWVAT